jgi:hypothetical protein
MTGNLVFIIRILLSISLYVFVALLFFTIWRQLKTQMKILGPKMNTKIKLTLVEKEDQEPYEINQTEALIGRDPNCMVHINDETVSAQHARIYLSDQHWWINDLNSTNGTFLNEEAIDRPCVITNNDLIRLGKIQLMVNVEYPDKS